MLFVKLLHDGLNDDEDVEEVKGEVKDAARDVEFVKIVAALVTVRIWFKWLKLVFVQDHLVVGRKHELEYAVDPIIVNRREDSELDNNSLSTNPKQKTFCI